MCFVFVATRLFCVFAHPLLNTQNNVTQGLHHLDVAQRPQFRAMDGLGDRDRAEWVGEAASPFRTERTPYVHHGPMNTQNYVPSIHSDAEHMRLLS